MHTSYEGLTRNIFEKCYVSKLKLLRVTYSFHHLEKFWIGHIYALAILDNGFPFGGQAGDGECHGDAVIHMAMDLGARKREASFDDHAVIGRGYVTAHSLKVFSDCSDPVGLLYLQFGSILDDGCAFCMGSHNCEDGDLIDQGRDDVPLYRSAFQMTGAD